MDKDRANKLDQLFQEKLQQHEISPEENYWPYLEKSLTKMSFYKFGWRHINIYNITLGILLLTVPIIYALFQSNQKSTDPLTPPQEIIDSAKKSDVPQNQLIPAEAAIQIIQKKQKEQKSMLPDSSSSTLLEKTNDSLPIPVLTEENIPSLPQPIKVEEKKPKKIIYVVQQDTIVEKDTIKVRRKRKK